MGTADTVQATTFDAWLDDIADGLRRDSSRVGPLADWPNLLPVYRDAWRHRALREVPRLLLARALAEYDEDTGRPPSFVTMDFIRVFLARQAPHAD